MLRDIIPASQGNGNNSIGVPDWSKTKAISLPYIAEQNGFIWGGYTFIGWGDGGQYPNININGKGFFSGYESTHKNGGAVLFPVQKGDRITLSNYQEYYFYFIPSR